MRFFILFILLQPFLHNAQNYSISGTWHGVLVDTNHIMRNPFGIILEIKALTGYAKGILRLETEGNFTQFEVQGPYKNKKEFQLTSGKSAIKSSKNFSISPFSFQYRFDDSSEYVIGNITTADGHISNRVFYLEKCEEPYEMGGSILLNPSSTYDFAERVSEGIPSKSKRIKELSKFEVNAVLFATGESNIESTYFNYLQRLARILKSHSDLRIKLIGHTDSDGSQQYNENLSKTRAFKIQEALIGYGVTADRMVIEFRGENDPRARNTDLNGKQLNRRVEFEFH
jgi:outer membrane protein OmpA-like peptidoglycan-associated protein